jgi:hypothetical protein
VEGGCQRAAEKERGLNLATALRQYELLHSEEPLPRLILSCLLERTFHCSLHAVTKSIG